VFIEGDIDLAYAEDDSLDLFEFFDRVAVFEVGIIHLNCDSLVNYLIGDCLRGWQRRDLEKKRMRSKKC
jgi:hypothetical protein